MGVPFMSEMLVRKTILIVTVNPRHFAAAGAIDERKVA